MIKIHNLKTFYTTERQIWRKWLSENFETEKEIWFIFPTKQSGEIQLPYNDVVEEALCFGWIDSTSGHLDNLHEIRRFSPRKKNSNYSRLNVERLIWLENHKMIHPKIRNSIINIISNPYKFPRDIIDEIKKDDIAWNHFKSFSEPYKRIRISHINDSRSNPIEFKKRLEKFISKTRLNKLIKGYGSSDKYYK